MDTDTIAAVATPVGSGGIGIIKISGPDALKIAESVFQKSDVAAEGALATGPFVFTDLQSHRLYHGHIVDAAKGRVLDEVLLAVMLAPHTYTKEDLVEINTHSGHVVLAAVLELVLKKGARLAEPGEFTKRAYLNGRIDLTQAEAVIDIITSRTDKSLAIAASQIKGDLKTRVESIRNVLFDILTETEAVIDFPEDVGDVVNPAAVVSILQKKVVAPLQKLVHQYENAHVFRDGLKMAVVGKPNVGKSSLLNRLLQNDRAIVTPIPGTTRDLIEETLNIHGIPVVIADTAGLHDSDDPVEVIGIQKTQAYISGSDLILFMVDASELLTREDHNIYAAITDKRQILVINKIDLMEDGCAFKLPETWQQAPHVLISALYGQGLSDLKALIAQVAVGEHQPEAGHTIIPNLRHKIALEKSLQLAVSAAEFLSSSSPLMSGKRLILWAKLSGLLSGRMLSIKFSAGFASENDVSRETSRSPEGPKNV